MSNPSATPTVHYRLTPEGTGIKLDIWEPANKTEHRKAPFHFFVSYQLSSYEEAQHILDQYLLDNDVCGAVCLDAETASARMTMTSSRMQTYAV